MTKNSPVNDSQWQSWQPDTVWSPSRWRPSSLSGKLANQWQLVGVEAGRKHTRGDSLLSLLYFFQGVFLFVYTGLCSPLWFNHTEESLSESFLLLSRYQVFLLVFKILKYAILRLSAVSVYINKFVYIYTKNLSFSTCKHSFHSSVFFFGSIV